MTFKNKDSEIPEWIFLLMVGGVIGGIAGGIAFGILKLLTITNVDFFIVVAGLFIDSSDPLIGGIVHLLIAIFFGLLFGTALVLIPRLGSNQVTTLSGSIIWSFILWIIAANVLMPLLLGQPLDNLITNLFTLENWISQQNLEGLLGHLIYGVVLGLATWNLPKLLN